MAPRKGLMVLVAGTCGPAQEMVRALGGMPGIANVRQVAKPSDTDMIGVDVVLDMMGGVTPAFNAAMMALERGVACVTANPMLLAAHGRVLQAAGQGQQAYFGFEGAGFGLPLADMLAVLPVARISMALNTAANMALARMAFRHETMAQVQAHLNLQKTDMTDWSGKLTQARAIAVHGQWQPNWPKASAQVRYGLENISPADMKAMRAFGLQMVFGADMTHDAIYTGPLAVAADNPLLASGDDVLVLELEDGNSILLSQPGHEGMVESGMLADVKRFMRSRKVQVPLRHGEVAAREASRCYVQVPYAQREAVLGEVDNILHDTTAGDGLWQAVVEGADCRRLKVVAGEGVAYPLCGVWDVPAHGGLRLVG